MQSKFVHLRLHTEYSMVDGIIKIKPLMQNATNNGHLALAITDHSNLYALIKFYSACRAVGIKPIAGADFYLENPRDPKKPFGFSLLAMNSKGYRNLCELISKAWLENQIDGKAIVKKHWLETLNQGLIALSGASAGELFYYIQIEDEKKQQETLDWWKSTFEDRFYLEIQRRNLANDEFNLMKSAQLASLHNLPLVATNSVCFLEKEEFFAHEARVCISEGDLLYRDGRASAYTQEEYFKTPEQMQELFADLPSAIENSYLIAQRCNLELSLGKSYLPDYPIPDGMGESEYFAYLSNQGLEERAQKVGLSGDREIYQKRLDMELDVIINMGFAGYFLIVMDFIRYSKNQDIPVGPGRGSGAGSLVAYSLGITDLDPIKYDLLFERFLNPERVSLPDFDVDFCVEGRERVIEYVADKYGHFAVSQIVTFGSMASKGVVRDVARVQGKPYSIGDKLSKMIPNKGAISLSLKEAFEEEEILRTYLDEDEDAKEVWEMSLKLEGITRNIGKHAGGVVIAPSNLIDFSPIMGDEDGKSIIVQFDKSDIEKAGLVKFDFLGLKTLTTMKWALEEISANRLSEQEKQILQDTNNQTQIFIDENPVDKEFGRIDMAKIPLTDKKVFEMLQRGSTSGVFQLESDGMRKLVKKLAPDRLEDLIALVALYRPGPLESGMVDDFIARKKGIQPLAWPHPDYQLQSLQPVLQDTYGIILYQEQVMQIARIMAGYSLGGADLLRRAMGKKNVEEMQKQRAGFVSGSVENGIKSELAGQIFDLVEKFAGYGFNKSHSAAYGLIAYQTAWLKANYKAEYMAAFLSGEFNSTDKIQSLLMELPSMGLEIVAPNINECNWRFRSSGNKIYYGLGAIKGSSEKMIERVVEDRKANGAYTDIFDFCLRVGFEFLNKRIMESLLFSGAFDCLGDRFILTLAMPDAIVAAESKRDADNLQLGNLFESLEQEEKQSGVDVYKSYKGKKEWSKFEKLQLERQVLGFYLSDHPIGVYKDDLKSMNCISLSDLRENKKPHYIAGVFTAAKIYTETSGNQVCKPVLEDAKTKMEFKIRDKNLIPKIQNFKVGDLVILKGSAAISNYSQELEVRVEDVFGLDELRNSSIKAVVLNLNQNSDVNLIHDKIQRFRRDKGWNLEFVFKQNEQDFRFVTKTEWRLDANQATLDMLYAILPKESISFVR